MASNAFTGHLLPLLRDADHLYDASSQLPAGIPGRPLRVAALNRAVVVTCASAWEAYIEELVRESLNALRPAAPPLGSWPALNASVRGQLGRFNNPNTENIRMLVSDTIGLQDIQTHWAWQNCTSALAVQRLAEAMALRHQIAHGVNPRPVVATFYSSQLPDFFSQAGSLHGSCCPPSLCECSWHRQPLAALIVESSGGEAAPIGSDEEWLARRWKGVVVTVLLVTATSITALVTVHLLSTRTDGMTDERLIGTWQSDVDRTIACIRQQKPLDDKQETALRKLFGKTRITYSPTTYTTELDGTIETYRYEVLGTDKVSVVIHEVERGPSSLDALELSEFTLIHLDGPDSYWLYTPIGGIREYFKRVK